ncbi:MAG: anaerobic ribonucleoside-triphosphate reductase activating protein [Alphaproteobacteria bacterium]|nr:anaerobic ribonucleoside-triphosphate reductase activating protein [Alphaproteobacteria bacterium]
MTNILVGGVETFRAVDFPGKLAAVLFLQGCPWRCPFCYNTDLQLIGKKTDFVWEKFIDFLIRRQGRLDAVVFSGGEPLVQEGLQEAMYQVKKLGFQIGLHTGGYRPHKLAEVLPLVDWIGLDIKAPFEEKRYAEVTQTNHLKEVLQSLEMILASGKDFECRTTCDPRLLTKTDLQKMAEDLYAKGVRKYFLQKYRPIPSDTQTTDSDCENILSDSQLLEYLQTHFEEFEVRK